MEKLNTVIYATQSTGRQGSGTEIIFQAKSYMEMDTYLDIELGGEPFKIKYSSYDAYNEEYTYNALCLVRNKDYSHLVGATVNTHPDPEVCQRTEGMC